jgi:hypothetical protein
MAFAILLVGMLQPLSASAASVSGGTHVLFTRQHTPKLGSGNLAYHGGPVMVGTTNAYAIFWEPTGSFVSSTYNSLISRYFGDIGPSKLYKNNKQYTQGSGGAATNAVFAGSWVDTAAYPGNPIPDTQVQQEVTHAQSVNSWKSSINNIFFVFTAKGENICLGGSCSFSTFCAYHGAFGSNTIYAAMPYTGTNLNACGVRTSPNHDFDADSTINVTSHEQNEAATDPLLNAWYDNAGYEIGDKCAWIFGPTKKFGGDVKLNGHPYQVQEEWDNHKSSCVLKGP